MLDTPPKTTIFGDLKVKADLLTCDEEMEWVISMTKGQGQIPYKEGYVLLEVSRRSRLAT